jgi:hypothetical protein
MRAKAVKIFAASILLYLVLQYCFIGLQHPPDAFALQIITGVVAAGIAWVGIWYDKAIEDPLTKRKALSAPGKIAACGVVIGTVFTIILTIRQSVDAQKSAADTERRSNEAQAQARRLLDGVEKGLQEQRMLKQQTGALQAATRTSVKQQARVGKVVDRSAQQLAGLARKQALLLSQAQGTIKGQRTLLEQQRVAAVKQAHEFARVRTPLPELPIDIRLIIPVKSRSEATDALRGLIDKLPDRKITLPDDRNPDYLRLDKQHTKGEEHLGNQWEYDLKSGSATRARFDECLRLATARVVFSRGQGETAPQMVLGIDSDAWNRCFINEVTVGGRETLSFTWREIKTSIGYRSESFTSSLDVPGSEVEIVATDMPYPGLQF